MSPERSARWACASSPGARPAWTRPSRCFREQAEALVAGGVDLFMLETFRDLNEMGAAIAAVRSVSDLPIVAQMTTEEDGNSLDGTPPEQFAPALVARGAHVVGVNCSVGPAPMLETVERMSEVVTTCHWRRSPTPASRATSRAATSTCARRTTWRPMRAGSSSGVRLVGGLLRHHARAHPPDPARGESDGARRGPSRCPGRRGPDAARQSAACAAARAARGEIRAGPQTRRRSVRHHRRGAAVARTRCHGRRWPRPARYATTRWTWSRFRTVRGAARG